MRTQSCVGDVTRRSEQAIAVLTKEYSTMGATRTPNTRRTRIESRTQQHGDTARLDDEQ